MRRFAQPGQVGLLFGSLPETAGRSEMIIKSRAGEITDFPCRILRTEFFIF